MIKFTKKLAFLASLMAVCSAQFVAFASNTNSDDGSSAESALDKIGTSNSVESWAGEIKHSEAPFCAGILSFSQTDLDNNQKSFYNSSGSAAILGKRTFDDGSVSLLLLTNTHVVQETLEGIHNTTVISFADSTDEFFKSTISKERITVQKIIYHKGYDFSADIKDKKGCPDIALLVTKPTFLANNFRELKISPKKEITSEHVRIYGIGVMNTYSRSGNMCFARELFGPGNFKKYECFIDKRTEKEPYDGYSVGVGYNLFSDIFKRKSQSYPYLDEFSISFDYTGKGKELTSKVGCAPNVITAEGGFSGGPVLLDDHSVIGVYSGAGIMPFRLHGDGTQYYLTTHNVQLISEHPFISRFVDSFIDPKTELLYEDLDNKFTFFES